MKITELARKLNAKGDQFIGKHGLKDFHKFAADLLSGSDLAKAYDYQELVAASFNKQTSSIQNFKQLEFSDLPLTLSREKHCFIEVYFWRRRPTTIHNHHFSGAFMCLTGNNVDLEFTFKRQKKIGKFHETGELTLQETRNLVSGSVAEIAPLNKFIHQNHHQAGLTVNLCFRTPDLSGKNLSNYLSSGLRYEKDPELMGRSARLKRFIDIGEFDPKKLKFSTDDAVHFLIQHMGTESRNPRLIAIMKAFDKRLKDEYGLDVHRLINEHDAWFEKLENDYQ